MTEPTSASPSSSSDEQPEYPRRRIRSFVMRPGRMTEGQKKALERDWPVFGLEPGVPVTTKQLFGDDRPLVFEIGFGMGDSLVQMAQQEPGKGFIGVEVHLPGVGRLLHRTHDEGLTNLRVYQHDAVEVLEQCLPDASIDRLQLYFPDPWHKKRHHKRRIVQPDFAQLVRRKLKIGGIWHLATDWENYAEHMLDVLSAAEGYRNCSPTGDYVPRPEFRPETKFERRGERLGHGVWDLMFERIA